MYACYLLTAVQLTWARTSEWFDMERGIPAVEPLIARRWFAVLAEHGSISALVGGP